MFWGLILKSNKKYTQTLEKSFHLSQASLDHGSSDADPVQVMYTHDDNSYLLCTLQKGKVYQCQLDLNFQEGDKLCFSTKGNGIVHLTGFLVEEDDFDQFGDMDGDMEDESEDEAVEDLREKLQKKTKPGKEAAAKKKQPVAAEDDSSEQEEADSDDEEAAEQDSGEEEGADSDEMEEDDDEEDSDEEEAPAPPAKQQKLDAKAQQNGKKQKNGLENGDAKKQEKKDEKPQIQKLQGGLMVQDLKTGSGAEAKPGKKIQVYYEGRLKTNNKMFDSTKTGPGFKLTLGRGEVIKGWDVGLAGMKVGGKRRLVIPPGLAYGQRGQPPVIPQNATLVFDIELKNVL